MHPASMARSALAIALLSSAPAHADEESLRKEMEALRAQVAALQDQVNQMRAAQPAPAVAAAPAVAPAPAIQPADTARPAPVASPADTSTLAAAVDAPPNGGLAVGESTRIWGYGELNYNHPTGDSSDTQADLRRAVLGFSHAFDPDTHVYGEIEWEHAVVSADDQGETEVEQLYVEHQLAPPVAIRAGLTLIPLGFLNEHHEPTNYYGVERNYVETAIIPTTWREGGVSALGTTESGFSWNVGVVTAQNLANWDPADPEVRASPLGAIHQELQLAKARDLAIYGGANWQGILGLTLGGGVFSSNIGQGDTPLAEDSRMTIGEVHARWQSGPWDLSALYTYGTISDTEALNLTFIGNPYPVPESFWGGYLQGAWRFWQRGESSMAAFARYEAFNTAASFAPVPFGLGVPTADTEKVWTIGINYYLTPSVVFKADYQNFNITDATLGYGNRFDLGVGYQF